MKNDLKQMKNFFSLFQSLWIPYIIATLAVASRNFIITFLNALISSKIIETVSYKLALFDSLIQVCIWVVCFAIFDSIGIYSQTTIIHRISIKLRSKMFSHMINSSLKSLDSFGNREELLSRMNYDIDNAVGLLSYGLLSPIMCGISGIGATCVILAIDWKACVLIYTSGLIVFGLQIKISSLMRKNATLLQQAKSDVLTVSMQTFQDSTDIKISSLRQYVTSLFSGKIKNYYKILNRGGKINGVNGAIQGILNLLAFFGVFLYCFFTGMKLETIVLVIQVSPLIATMILSITGLISNVQQSMVGIDRIIELFELPLEDKSGKDFAVNFEDKGFETKNLKCNYDSKVVKINDFSIKKNNGNMIALKGESGCGKTTLLRLILKLYPYESGNLLFFNQEIRSCSMQTLRKNIAYVPQENIIFPGTVRENILLGNPDKKISDQEIMDLMSKLDINKWIEEIGLDLQFKENGCNASGGQKQMIAIARAILYNKPIIILDEAFSAVDKRATENTIEFLKKADKYVLIVTHNDSIMQKCDAVVHV